MKEMLGGFAFLLLLAAQVFAVAALHGRSDRAGELGKSADRPGAGHGSVDRIDPSDRYVDRCRTLRARYLASLFRSARS